MAIGCRILAIDGGGIRGVIPAYILQQLEATLSKPCYQSFDIIAGTSTGGLIALGLTTPTAAGKSPRTAQDILDIYLKDESQLFVYQSSGLTTEAEYFSTDTETSPPSGIEPFIQSLFGTTTLSQARSQLQSLGMPMPRQVFTTCYCVNGDSGVQYAPYLFNWIDAVNNTDDDYCIWEAARGTTAAPTYFPLANVGSGVSGGSQAKNRWVCDGGVTANNPALYALAQAFNLGLCSDLSEVLIVSLGTGLYDAGLAISNGGNWGLGNWAIGVDTNQKATYPLINVLGMSNVLAPDQQLQLMLPQDHYFRLEPTIPYNESKLDGADTQALHDTAVNYIAPGGEGYGKFQSVISQLGS